MTPEEGDDEFQKALTQTWEAQVKLERALDRLRVLVSDERQKWMTTNAAIRQAMEDR